MSNNKQKPNVNFSWEEPNFEEKENPNDWGNNIPEENSENLLPPPPNDDWIKWGDDDSGTHVDDDLQKAIHEFTNTPLSTGETLKSQKQNLQSDNIAYQFHKEIITELKENNKLLKKLLKKIN